MVGSSLMNKELVLPISSLDHVEEKIVIKEKIIKSVVKD
jgi:hypothetical protein